MMQRSGNRRTTKKIYNEISTKRFKRTIYEKNVIELSDPNTKIRMLCLDGGGVKGVVEAVTLEYIHFCLQDFLNGNPINQTFDHLSALIRGSKHVKYHPEGVPKVHKMFDVLVGTSMGAIMSVAMARAHVTPRGLQNEVYEIAADIFPPTRCWNIPHHICQFVYAGFKAGRHRYSEEPMEEYLKRKLENCTWSGQEGDPRIGIIATKSEDSTIHVFSSRIYQRSKNVELWHALRASTAAPVYFPSIIIQDDMMFEEAEYIDGGLCANCPVSYAMDILKDEETLSVLISIGCGESEPSKVPIARVFQHARSDEEEWEKFKASRQAKSDPNLHRLAPSLKSGLGKYKLSDSSKVDEMIQDYRKWLSLPDSNWYRIDIVKAAACLFAKSIIILQASVRTTNVGYVLDMKIKIKFDGNIHQGQCLIRTSDDYTFDFVIRLRIGKRPINIDGLYEKSGNSEQICLQFLGNHIIGSPINFRTTYERSI